MKKVLVTGSGRRIGKELVKLFAKNSWDVIIHYNKSEVGAKTLQSEVEQYGVKSYIFQADLSNEFQTRTELIKCFENFGVPNVFINNAGVFPKKMSLLELEESILDSTFAINTKSIIFTSKVFAEYANENAKIINILSLGGLQIWKERIPYNITKAASIQLNKALARELAPNITVNAINPGFIVLEEDNDTDIKPISLDKIPMKRYGNIEDIFDAVFYFANATNYITGQYLNIDGGFNDCY